MPVLHSGLPRDFREQEPCALQDIMALSQLKSIYNVQFDLSVVEIYCESIKDLLSEGPGSTGLSVQQDKTFGIIIAGATKVWYLTESLHMEQCMYDCDAICGISAPRNKIPDSVCASLWVHDATSRAAAVRGSSHGCQMISHGCHIPYAPVPGHLCMLRCSC